VLVSETGVPIGPGFFSTSPARNNNNKNISIIFDIITKFVLDNNIPFLIITYIQFNIKSIISFKLIDTLEGGGC
jgi:hypothetical protein